MDRKTEALKSAQRAVSDAAHRLKDAGFDDLATDLRASLAKIRREANNVEAAAGHPDLFGSI